jgi:L-ectoine synthase
MIVRDYHVAKETPRKVGTRQWDSVCLLLKDDGMGFSFHVTTIYAGAEVPMHYRNHLESVYCISGEGSIEDLATGERHAIRPGIVYALDANDPHVLRADSELVLACVFNPPLIGLEVHDETGAYPPETGAVALPPAGATP